jgi:hypothetical protein
MDGAVDGLSNIGSAVQPVYLYAHAAANSTDTVKPAAHIFNRNCRAFHPQKPLSQ